MALSDAERIRIQYELGFNVLTINSEPYIGHAAIFEQVIQPYMTAGASTTSSTTVTTPSAETPTALTVASATGISAGATLVVDVDGRQEIATVVSVSGSVVTVPLSLAHSGTYPVTVEGGESIVRSLLRQLRAVSDGDGSVGSAGAYAKALGAAGVKKVDEIEFHAPSTASGGNSVLAGVIAMRDELRRELARALGILGMYEAMRGGGGSSISVY